MRLSFGQELRLVQKQVLAPRMVDLNESITSMTGLLDRVIGLDALVPDGLDALVERRAMGKILVDPWR